MMTIYAIFAFLTYPNKIYHSPNLVEGEPVDNPLVEDALDLSGRKIVVFGGGAEMAPTRLWLEAGADVLWLDVQPPPKSWLDLSNMTGRLYWSETGADLLSHI